MEIGKLGDRVEKIELKETQAVEFKQSWRDEWLKSLSAFCNTQGGILYVGVDDHGEIIGIKNSKKLLEDIPNKLKEILGITASITLHTHQENEYLMIQVEKYPYPISYKGSYYQRSGSVTQELKGASLDHFLLTRQGRRWDGLPLPLFGEEDIDPLALRLFSQKAQSKKRIDEDFLHADVNTLIQKLHLKEGEYYKIATALLFGHNPQNYVIGSCIKIGYFASNTDLLYQDVIEGNLFSQVDKTIELVFSKYLKAWISYEGIQRVETFPLSQIAFREALINAVVHKDYARGSAIQISIYEDKLLLWNAGDLPLHWDIQTLLSKHSSEPHNPSIAYPFFLAGYIESWGRGIEKIIEESKHYNGIIPTFKIQNGFWIEFAFPKNTKRKIGNKLGNKLGNQPSKNSTNKEDNKDINTLTSNQKTILRLLEKNPTYSTAKIADKLQITQTAIEKNIKILKTLGLLERIGTPRKGYWQVKKYAKP